jgi:hypothetical protein
MQYAAVRTVLTKSRGWGLVADEDIKKGLYTHIYIWYGIGGTNKKYCMLPATKCPIFLLFQRQTTDSFCGREHTYLYHKNEKIVV